MLKKTMIISIFQFDFGLWKLLEGQKRPYANTRIHLKTEPPQKTPKSSQKYNPEINEKF